MAKALKPDCIRVVVTCASLRDWLQCSQFLPPCLNGSQRTTRIFTKLNFTSFQFLAGFLVNAKRISQSASQPASQPAPPPPHTLLLLSFCDPLPSILALAINVNTILASWGNISVILRMREG